MNIENFILVHVKDYYHGSRISRVRYVNVTFIDTISPLIDGSGSEITFKGIDNGELEVCETPEEIFEQMKQG